MRVLSILQLVIQQPLAIQDFFPQIGWTVVIMIRRFEGDDRMPLRKRVQAARLFHLCDDPSQDGIEVADIHNERGYRRIRRELARQFDVGWIDPNIEVVDVDLAGDRRLLLRHAVVNGSLLEEQDAKRVLQHLADLWTYDVQLREVDSSDTVLKEHAASPRGTALAA